MVSRDKGVDDQAEVPLRMSFVRVRRLHVGKYEEADAYLASLLMMLEQCYLINQ